MKHTKWEVVVKKKMVKKLLKLPKKIQEIFDALVSDLKIRGPNPGKRWANFSPLGSDKYHCHLTYSYVACWEVDNDKIKCMEVYYVGSRENAPY